MKGKTYPFQPLKEDQQTFLSTFIIKLLISSSSSKMKLNPIISEEIGIIVTTGNLSKTILFLINDLP